MIWTNRTLYFFKQKSMKKTVVDYCHQVLNIWIILKRIRISNFKVMKIRIASF